MLNCVIGAALYDRFPALPEGDLSRVRAALVNQDTLARVARRMGLGGEIRLGEGEQKSGGADRPSILADALEAVFGAVFVDGGFEPARAVIGACFGDVLAEADPAMLGKDPKTRLQEWLQARRMPVPEYVVTATSGEAHAQLFEVECRIPGSASRSPARAPAAARRSRLPPRRRARRWHCTTWGNRRGSR